MKQPHTAPFSSWLPRVVWGSVICGFLVLGIIIFTLTVLSDTEWIKTSLMSQLEQTLGGPIQIQSLNLDLFPSPSVDAKGVTFETQDSKHVSFQADHLNVGIGWQSFWQKTLRVNHITLDEPNVTIDISLLKSSEEPSTEPLPAIEELAVRNGHLHLLPSSEAQTIPALDVEPIQLTITQTTTEGPSLIHLSAQIADPEYSSTLALNGKLTVLESDQSLLIEDDTTPIFEFQGHIEGSQLNLGRLVEFVNEQVLDPPLSTVANILGNVSYALQNDTDLLTVSEFEISLNDWTLSGQGLLADLLQDSPQLDISGSSSPLALEQLSNLLPPDWIPENVKTILHNHQVRGIVKLEQGSFQIPLASIGPSNAEGILQVKNGQYLPAVGQPLIRNISGSITFTPSAFQFSQVQGKVSPFNISIPHASLTLQEHGALDLQIPNFQISEQDWKLHGILEFTSNQTMPPTLTVSGSSTPISIQRFSTLLPDVWLPASLGTTLAERQIDGEIELRTGSVTWKDDDANSLMPEGVFRVTDGQVLVDQNHPQMKNLSGGIVFESNLVRLVDVKGSIAASQLFVKEATLEWNGSDIWLDLYGNGSLKAHDVYQALQRDPRNLPSLEPLTIYHDARGSLQFSTHIQGSLAKPSQLQVLATKLLLDDIHLFPASDGLALQKLNGHVSFDNQGLRIQDFKGQLGESPIDIKGQWSFGKDSQSNDLSITSQLTSSDLKALYPSIPETFSTLDGTIDSTMSFSGSLQHTKYQANVDLTPMTLTVKGIIHKPAGIPAIFNAKGTVRDNQSIRMTQGTLSLLPYTLEAQGLLVWSDPPSIRGFFQTESGTGALLPPKVILGDGNLRLTSLGVKWGLEGKNWDWKTWTMKGSVEGSNRTAQSIKSDETINLQSTSIQWAQKNQKGKGEITLNEIPIESLFMAQSDSSPQLTGTTSLTTSLSMDLESPEYMQRSLTGKGKVQLHKGKIQTGPVLSKILGILNIPSLLMGKVNLLEEGLPYDDLTGDFSIQQGLLTTDNLALKSPVIKLTAAGSYDIPTENLESMIAVSPFGAYSNLLKDIPLFGSLMKGERKGLLTALFEVKGPRTKPEVTYRPIDSFTGGIKGLAQVPIDMLKNIITLPLPKEEKGQPPESNN